MKKKVTMNDIFELSHRLDNSYEYKKSLTFSYGCDIYVEGDISVLFGEYYDTFRSKNLSDLIIEIYHN